MTEPRDDIDRWLDAPIEPLPPSPGTYERIRGRARRRRRNHAIWATATAAAVVAGAVVAPRLVGLFPAGSSPVGASSSLQATPHRHSHPARGGPAVTPSVSGTGLPLPNGFAAISATFVGLKTGWALGTRTTPCSAAGGGCLALARTDNTGETWEGVPTPPTGVASDGTGVSQVRFLNRYDGWIFGPELWWTHDGGQSWHWVKTGGQDVTSLETVAGRAFAVFARCTSQGPSPARGSDSGPGPPWRGQCSSYQLYSAAAGTGAWQPVPGATSGPGSAAVVLAQRTGYLLGGNGATVTLARGPVSGTGAWSMASPPCPPGQEAQSPAAAQAASALLATAAPGQLYAVCAQATAGPPGSTASPAGEAAKQVVMSRDDGATWRQAGEAPIPGTAWSAAATPGGGLFIAASTGLYVSADGGLTWTQALAGPPGGFSYVGMTDAAQGFAIPAARGRYGILFTTDGGQDWQPSMVSGPG